MKKNRALAVAAPLFEPTYVIQLPLNYIDREFAGEYFCEFSNDDGLPVPLWTSKPRNVRGGTFTEMKKIFDFLRFRKHPVLLIKYVTTRIIPSGTKRGSKRIKQSALSL